jgi:glyoxylase-like metal-dependent hydrolase (beta-lactamase superfamily II)
MWRIYPLDVGDLEMDRSEAIIRRGMGQKVKEKFVAWYLTDGKRKILVDTGLPEEERSRKWHPYTNPRISEAQRIENALAARGAKPEDIELVILTHLHWDHAGNTSPFTNAKFVVSREELRYAIDPCPIHYVAYEAVQLGIEPAFLKTLPRTSTIDMLEREIFPGIVAIPTPGHTSGSISLVVTTTEGPYVITGDAVACYANLEGDPTHGLTYLPTGIYTDLLAMWSSMALIDAKALWKKDHVLPGHDSKVFQHPCYPYQGATGGTP